MAAQTDRGIPLSALSPKFLHTNSTSHTWPFSAIAELIDNAYDPDVSAKQFWIDKTRIKGLDCLTFMDNGAGMSYDKMHKMLSFGFSDKQAINGHVPVGLYGNGFKSGSMRLGKDAIVFSKTRDTMCVGLLSQSYLEAVQANHVVVPIVTFARVGHNQFRALPEHAASLQDILRYSLFKTEAELFSELRAINATCSTGSSGTRIIIWNLRRMSTGQPEFDFNVNRYDIQIPADVFESTSEKYKRQDRPLHSVPESDYSLRAYCSILYLKPRMQIVIRGQKVKTQLISKSLAYIAKDHYRPIFLNKRIRITFGYNTKSKEQYGIMMYHKNRLIKAYERVGCQLKANNRGVGVIGVIECNFLKPTHNKQDFDYTDEYRKTIYNLGVKLEEYWNEIRFKRDREDPNCTIPVEDTMKRPDQNWVQCDNCLKWRKLPDGIDCNLLPEKWFCHMNPDPQFRTCHAEEEPEDSDDDQPSYQKTYKQQERYNKMQQERNRQQMEQAKKKVEMERIAALAQQNETLRRQHEDLKRQLKQSNLQAQSPGTISQTPHSTVTNGTPQNTTRAGTGVTPSSANMPIISSVCSLSTPSRMKRTLPLNPEATEPKRGRPNGLRKRLSATEPAVSAETRSSSPVIIPDDDDDDILIVEASSTPRPGPSNFDLAKVKTERRVSEDPAGMHMECTDDAAVDVPSETTATAAAGASPAAPSPAAATESITTATTTSTVTVSTTPTTDTTAGSAAVGPAVVETAAVTEAPSASSSPRPQQLVSTMTQTEANQQVKDEEEEQRKKERENEERRKECGAMQEEERREEEEARMEVEEGIVVKMEKEADERSGAEEHGAEPVSESGPAPRAERSPPTGGGAELSSEQKEQLLREAQQQQDQLMELMQAVAQERDQYQAQVHQLTCKVQDLETQLEELSHSVVKKELCDQAVGTEEHGEDEEAGLLYQRAKQEVEELRRELERQEAMGRPEGESGREEEMKSCEEDELAIQVDALFRDLDQSNKAKDELQSRLESVEGQRDVLLSQCEQLRRELEELRTQGRPSEEVCPETHLTGEATPRQLAPLRTADGASVRPAIPNADAMESNGSVSPDANGRTADCSDGGVSNGTGESYRNGDVLSGAEDPSADGEVSTRAGDLSGEGDLPNDITGNGVGGRTQNVCNKPGPTDQADGLASLRKNMACLLVASLPKLYPERVNDSALTEQVLDEFFSRIASLGHDVESCPPS